VEHLGTIPYQSEIKWSARDLVPVVAKFPGGYLLTLLKQWIGKIA
jgi:hypothetical protein